MKKIISSRGMGKTTALINKAISEIRRGKKVIFICTNKNYVKPYEESFDPQKINFMTLAEFLIWSIGRNLKEYSILIDELDHCIAYLLGTSDFSYTLTVGEDNI